ncbi:MAG: hypothetical protein NVS3B10_07990 [Polyangiales bacterium]
MRIARSLSPVALVLVLALPATAGCGAEQARSAPPPPIALASATPAPSASTAPTAAASTTIKRVVVSLSRKSGTLVTTTGPDGTMTVTLDVLENGRGPHVDAKLRLAADGTIAALDAHGHHTMGTKVDETFVRDAGHARWKSLEETGDRDVAGAAFFLPISEVPDALGLLVPAMVKSGGPMPLLPGGTATLEKTGEATVKANGQDRHLVGYAIVGLDLTPTHVWMNDDGSWFGVVSPWWSVVPEGWEPAIAPLIDKQNQLDRARDAKLARELAHAPPAAGLAYTHARVLDVEHGKWVKDQTVIVVGDTIRAVGPSATVKVPAGAETVDLAGKALLPGMFDMHQHLGDADGVLDLASGVTTARDVGNDPDKLDDFKKRYDSGEAIGPHVVRFGFIEGRGDKAASSTITAETEAEAKSAVEFYAKRGYEGIKIYNSMKPELVPLLAKEAHARGMAVTGHIPVHMLANEAVRAGYDGIEHVNMLFLNFFATHETDTRDTTRFTLIGEKAAAFDLKSKPVVDFFELLRQHHTVLDPTIDAFEDLLVGEQGKIVPGMEAMTARLPPQIQRGFLTGGLPHEGKAETYRASFEKVLAMVKALVDAKLSVVVGTDALAGLMFHHELALYVRAGIPTADVLRMATLGAARTLKLDKKTGSIVAGKAADVFVVDGDPLAHIEEIGNVVSTMRGGVVFGSPALYATVGVTPRAK